jgi:hypothetical protein
MVPTPDPGVDLWAQRRERVERLRAEEAALEAEAAQEALEAAQEELEAEAAQEALNTAADTVAEPGEPTTPLEDKPGIGDAMPDGLEGLRRRRPDADAPDPSGAETSRSAAERVKQEARSGTATPTEEQQCRICFGGREEEAELGRLISPCLCAGSMRVSAPRPR